MSIATDTEGLRRACDAAGLDDRDRRLVYLWLVVGRSPEQIAYDMRASPGFVRRRMRVLEARLQPGRRRGPARVAPLAAA